MAEKSLAESEKFYRTIVETVSDVIFRLGPDQKIEFINPAIRFFGYEPSDLVGHTIEKFIDMGSADNQIIPKIATQDVGPLATSNLEVSFKFARESILGEATKPVPVLLDAFGLWDVSDEQVFKNEVEIFFRDTLYRPEHYGSQGGRGRAVANPESPDASGGKSQGIIHNGWVDRNCQPPIL